MHFRCSCGHGMVDTTDRYPYKGYYIGTEDYFELDAKTPQQAWHDCLDCLRTIFQCSECGRLFLYNEHSPGWLIFKPENHDQTRLLEAIRGRDYKVNLYGYWEYSKEPISFLEWEGAADLPGGFEKFSDWETLQRRYLELKDTFLRKERLRCARLRKDGELVDEWYLDGITKPR